MGMYTELVIAFELKEDTPDQIIETLEYMIDGDLHNNSQLDNEFLEAKNRHKFMLRSSSYYTDYPAALSDIYYNNITRTHHVSVRCSLKNYEDEIDSFLNWVMPYVNEYGHDFLGYSLYEESDTPVLIHRSNYVID